MRTRLVPVLAAVLVAIVGCTSDNGTSQAPNSTGATPSTATPSTATSSPTSSLEPRPTIAPEVADPVDLRPFHTKSCATLTPEQQRQVGFLRRDLVEHEASNDLFGVCLWRHNPKPATPDNYAYRLILHISGDPLAEAYADSNDRYAWRVFEPRRIRGLPAVVRSFSTPDDQCELIIGTGNGQGITINGTIIRTDPTLCDRFTTAAEWVIDTVRQARK